MTESAPDAGVTGPAVIEGEAHMTSLQYDVEHRLDIRWVAYRRRVGVVWTLVAGAALCGAAAIIDASRDMPSLLLYGVALLVSAAAGAVLQWWPRHAWSCAGYSFSRRGMTIREGMMWRRVVDVPWSRVQHTDVSQGPLERSHGLATLSIHTAGMTHARIRLHGLSHARALEVRAHLMNAVDDDVV